MYILRNGDVGYKELVISFKSIYINCYNLFLIDISQEDHDSILFRHESFQLWESECTGFLLNNRTKDFVQLNKSGMFILSLGSNSNQSRKKSEKIEHKTPDKRVITDDAGFEKMLHSIESVNFLQLERENYCHLDCMDPSKKVI